MKNLNGISLIDVMPDSITDDAKVEAAAKSIDVELATVSSGVDKPAIYAGFDTLTSATLDHLAAQYDVTVWRDDWPDNVKRSVLSTAITDKRKKGTVGAVKNAVASLGSAVTIKEWWETGENVHTFKIYVAQGEIEGHVASDVQEDLIAAVEDAKPVRSHYDFIIQQPIGGTLNACGYVRMIACARISSTETEQIEVSGVLGVGAFVRPMVMRRLSGFAETEIVMPPPEFGEIIKAYLTTGGAANTSTISISSANRPLYDAAGSPLLFESGYKYDVLGVGNKGIHGDAYLNSVSPGEQMAVSASYNFRVSSNIVFVFKVASDENFSIYPVTIGYSIQGSVNIAAGSVSVLYGMGSGTPLGYSSIAGKVLRDVISSTGERLGTDGFDIERNDNGYAILRNNRAESVRVGRVIFSD